MAHVNERVRADGSVAYRVMFRLDGRQTSETFGDERAAKEFAALVDEIGGEAALRVRDARDDNASRLPTLAEWLEHHLDHSPGITDGTKAEYRRLAARSWIPMLGHLPVDAVDRDAVARWVERQKRTLTRRGKPTSAKSIKNMHALLSTIMASAVDAKLRPDNPCRGLGLPQGEREEMCFLTHEEFMRILTHVPAHWKPLLVTLAGTGMRWGEATALQWGDVDLDGARPSIRVVRAWKHGETQRVLGIPKTSRSRRTITLPPEVVDVLRPLRGVATATDLVFRGPRSGQVHHQSFRRVWHAAVAASGIEKRPRVHDLRHSHASWLIAAHWPLPRIQRRLGHESISTTIDVYGHLSDDDEDLAALSVALSPVVPQVLPSQVDVRAKELDS